MVQYSIIVLLVALYGAYGIGYERYDLVGLNICHERRNGFLAQWDSLIDSKKHTQLMTDFSTGVIYGQSWNSSSFKRFSECKFILQAQPAHGIYLTVRKLNMRQDAKGSCIDTVSVKQSNGKKIKFCYTPKDVPRSFADPTYLKITIRLEHLAPLASIDDSLHIQLVATQKRLCTGSHDELSCDPFGSQTCIHKSFSNDGTINCPSCIDEPSCEQEPVEIQSVSNNKEKVVLTAFVSLILTAIIFCACFLCLYKSRQWVILCNGNGDSSSNGTGLREPVRRTVRSRTQHGRGGNIVAGVHSFELRGSSNDLRPSAPSMEEKDLPPSYDALFPTATAVASGTSGPTTTVSAATSPTIPKTTMDREADLTK